MGFTFWFILFYDERVALLCRGVFDPGKSGLHRILVSNAPKEVSAINNIKAGPKNGVNVRIFNKAKAVRPIPDIFIKLNSRSLMKDIQLTITTELITVAIRTDVMYTNETIIVTGKPIIVTSDRIANMGTPIK